MALIEEDIAKIKQMRFGQFADLSMGKVYVKEFFGEQIMNVYWIIIC